ncbi:MAG: hypothetical protein C1943_13510 [Halochromatium sp.]|nr:hypothetical protein [Halochromatium sp.]
MNCRIQVISRLAQSLLGGAAFEHLALQHQHRDRQDRDKQLQFDHFFVAGAHEAPTPNAGGEDGGEGDNNDRSEGDAGAEAEAERGPHNGMIPEGSQTGVTLPGGIARLCPSSV